MDIRQLKEDEFEQAIQLADQTFRERGHTSMREAFPQVFSQSLKQSFGAFDDDRLISFIGLVPSVVKLNHTELDVFSIGAVCTDSKYRKKGISSAVLKNVYQYIDRAGASILFVSGDRGMYKRNQCYHYGKNFHYLFKKPFKMDYKYEGIIRQGKSFDIFSIDQLRKQRKVRFESSIYEWSTLFNASGYPSIFKMKQSLFVAETNGSVEGYVVIGLSNETGHKEQGIVTEYGGKFKAVVGILYYLLETMFIKEIKMTIPWHEKDKYKFTDHLQGVNQSDGTLYLINPQRLLKQLFAYFKKKEPYLTKYIDIIPLNNHEFRLTTGLSTYRLTRAELTKLFFSVQERNFIKELQPVTPIPLPYTEGLYFV